ncbi:hypothetical protein BCS65_18365 [Vibrio cyclitrophicus]
MQWKSLPLACSKRAEQLLRIGLIDIVDTDKLFDSAVSLIQDANRGAIDWQARRNKTSPLV